MTNDSFDNKTGPIVVLGAGPAGLACAHQLLANGVNTSVIVLDRAKVPGGAGASFKWKQHTLDYGPHAFHTRGGEPERLIRSLFEDEPEVMVQGRKRVKVFLNRKFLEYPLKIKEALLKFNPFTSIRIILEFSLTMLIHQIVSIPVESFEDWGRKRFGSTLYQLSFGNYTRKVWKTDPNQISRKFASEKIQGFSFINLIRKLLRVGGQVTEPYYQTWIYHRDGSGAMYQKLADKVTSLGGEVVTQADVKSVQLEGHYIKQITYEKDGVLHNLTPQFVVNTIGLPTFIGLVGDSVPFFVRHHASKLRYISLVLVYIEFSVETIGEDNWFYLLDNEFISNRVTEQKNLSAFTMEKGKTVLSFELTCREKDDLWCKSDQELYEIVLSDCRRVPKLAANIPHITDFAVRRAPNVYECYYKHFDAHAEVAIGFVQDIKNAATIGRRGLFLQGDMHQSVEMGMVMGELLASSNLAATDRDIEEKKRNFAKRFVGYMDNY